MLHLDLSVRVRARRNDERAISVEVDAREYAQIVDELRRRRGEIENAGCFKLSPITRQLMEMAVGDKIKIPPRCDSAITTNRRTARKHMNNPDARWHAQTLPCGNIEIERLVDGAENIYGKPRHPLPAQLAAMNLHGRLIVEYSGRYVPSPMKARARHLMGVASADWRFTSLAKKGLFRVVRTR